MATILLVEDEPIIADTLRYNLEREGYTVLTAADLKVDLGSRRVWRGERETVLSAKEFDLLVCLMRNRGLALSRDLLLERVWGYDFLGDSRTVDVHVRWLREKIEPDPSQPVFIHTVRGTGYRFEAPAHTNEIGRAHV